MDSPEQKRMKADSGAVVTEEQAAEFAAKAAAEGRPRLRILTGDRTTGKLHIGHYVGSLKHRVKYQSLYDTFILMADVQALTTHYDRPEILKQSVREVALDYMAAGIDPNQATIFVQSLVPAIAELTVYYGLLVPVSSLQNNPTVKTEAEQHGFSTRKEEELYISLHEEELLAEPEVYTKLLVCLVDDFPELGSVSQTDLNNAVYKLHKNPTPDFLEIMRKTSLTIEETEFKEQFLIAIALESAVEDKSMRREIRNTLISTRKEKGFSSLTYGFLGYPVSQAADITFVGAHLVPVGPDQVPLIELCREVVHRFNSQYGKKKRVLTSPYALLGVREALQGIDGNAKMSKSLNNAIYLSETDAEIWAKVKPAPTDPQRARREDPGRPEVCNIFSYHKVFNQAKEPAIDESALGVATVEEVAENCRGAKWGCVECKQQLCRKLGAILDPMRERRADWEKRPDDLVDVLKAGTARANEEGQMTLERVRSAMHMDYWPA